MNDLQAGLIKVGLVPEKKVKAYNKQKEFNDILNEKKKRGIQDSIDKAVDEVTRDTRQ